MMKTPLMLASVVLVAGSLQSAVFDDAIGWYCGGIDRNDDGFVDSNEWVDRRRAGVADSPSNQTSRNKETKTVAWVTAEVDCAYSGKTLSGQKCIEFNQKYLKDGVMTDDNGSIKIPLLGDGISNPNVISNHEFTIVIRFKPANSTKADGTAYTNPYYEYLLGIGDDCTSGSYHGLKVSVGRSGRRNGRMCFSCPVYGLDNWYYEDPTTCLLTNETYEARSDAWCELVVTSSGRATSLGTSILTYRLYQPGRAEQVWTSQNCYCLPDLTKVLVLGGANSRNDSTAYRELWYQGKVHMLGVWNRVLSDDEISEALSTTSYLNNGMSAEVFKFGNDENGHELFGGEKGVDAAVSTTEDYVTAIPSGFVAGTKLTVTAAFDKYQKGLPQFFRLKPTSDSAKGKVALKVGTTDLDVVNVKPGVPTVVMVPGELLTDDSTTFVLICTEAGEGGVRFSTIELCGSWSLGVKDGSSSDTIRSRQARDFIFGVHTTTNMLAYWDVGDCKSVKYHFVLPEGLEDGYRYELKASSFEGGSEPYEPIIRVIVNGTTMGDWDFKAKEVRANADKRFLVGPKNLIAGTNVIELVNVGVNGQSETGETIWNWGRCDYLSFAIKKKIEGMVLIFR